MQVTPELIREWHAMGATRIVSGDFTLEFPPRAVTEKLDPPFKPNLTDEERLIAGLKAFEP